MVMLLVKGGNGFGCWELKGVRWLSVGGLVTGALVVEGLLAGHH